MSNIKFEKKHPCLVLKTFLTIGLKSKTHQNLLCKSCPGCSQPSGAGHMACLCRFFLQHKKIHFSLTIFVFFFKLQRCSSTSLNVFSPSLCYKWSKELACFHVLVMGLQQAAPSVSMTICIGLQKLGRPCLCPKYRAIAIQAVISVLSLSILEQHLLPLLTK